MGAALFWLLVPAATAVFWLTLVALLAAGIWAAGVAERHFGRVDDPRIVIDEVVGQMVALAPLACCVRGRSAAGVAAGFLAFRCLDIAKPGPVRWAERSFRGGVAVLADDLVAGGLAAGLLAAGLWLGLEDI